MDYQKFERSTLIDILANLFKCLHYISPAKFIKFIIGKLFTETKNYRIIDIYVTAWPILLICILLFSNFFPDVFRTMKWLIFFLILIRFIEMICVTFDVLVFDRYLTQKRGEKYLIASPERTFILGIFNYFEILLSFSIIYFLSGIGHFAGDINFNNIYDSFYFSALTLTTLGYGDIQPASNSMRLISVIEALAGVLAMALIIARGISLLKPPDSISDLDSKVEEKIDEK